MELDEVIYAVGELYLKYRKGQQIVVDQNRRIQELEAQLAEHQEEAEVEKPEPKGRRKK